jgi:hypothetical protein
MKHSCIYTCNKWMPNLQAAHLGTSSIALGHRTEDLRASSRLPTQRALTSPVVSQAGAQNVSKEDLWPPSMSPTQQVLCAKKTYDHPVYPPCNGFASSPHQLFIASQQLPACVHVTTAENSGVSTWVSRTFNIPQFFDQIVFILELNCIVKNFLFLTQWFLI